VFIPGIGAGKINGAYRWIDLRLFNFQPSEMMKVVMILFMACPTEAEDDIIQPNRVNAKMASNNFLSGFCSIVSNISPAFYPMLLLVLLS
jgi:cell division protein FtsW (lipid II flippase)